MFNLVSQDGGVRREAQLALERLGAVGEAALRAAAGASFVQARRSRSGDRWLAAAGGGAGRSLLSRRTFGMCVVGCIAAEALS